jgi:hypothetical protein
VPKGKKLYVSVKIAILSLSLIICLSQCIDAFVDELRWEEQDSAKRDKIHKLKLTSEEWAHVNKFLGLLSIGLCFLLCINA